MNKIDIKKQGNKIVIGKSPAALEKEAREKRIKDRKNLDKTNYTNKEVMEHLNDTNDRISEIYDIIKALQNGNR